MLQHLAVHPSLMEILQSNWIDLIMSSYKVPSMLSPDTLLLQSKESTVDCAV